MTKLLLFTTIIIFSCSLACFLSGLSRSLRSRAGNYFLDFGFILLSVVLFLESIDLGVFLPVANGHQAAVFFAWSVLLMFLFVRRGPSTGSFSLVLIPFVMGLLTVALVRYRVEVTIPREFLSDQLFAVHTLSAFLAYAAFALSFVTSVLYLLQHYSLKSRRSGKFYRELPNLEKLEQTGFFMISLGVPLMTITLLTGFIWSKGRFGHYWLWEPKVIFATLTWFLYTFLLYMRFIRTMRGTRLMTYLMFSFSSVLITFLGSGIFQQQVHAFH